MSADSSLEHPDAAPSLALMHCTFVLAGFGTMLLGPILPLLGTQWALFDSQLGVLLLAQFCGATLGGLTVSSRLGRDLMIGLVAAAIGFGFFAWEAGIKVQYSFSTPYYAALPALLIGGFGVGRIIATVNILAGARYTANRAVALTRLNFTWSFGALLSPLLAAWLVAVPLQFRLTGFAILLLICAAVLAIQLRREPMAQSNLAAATTEAPLQPRLFLYFAALLFLYGGLETCLSGWLTTYALRYGQTSLVLSEYTMVLLLCGLTAGRALASWLLLKMRDTTLQRIALVCSAALAAALAAAHSASLIATFAVLLGITLAPIFPATFAVLMAHRPPARTAGVILAASGIGAAALPSLIGVISTRTGSLQTALAVPVAAAVAMLLLSTAQPKST